MRGKVDYQERYVSFLEEQVRDLKKERDSLLELLGKGEKEVEEVKEVAEFKPIKKALSWPEVRKALEEKAAISAIELKNLQLKNKQAS